MTKHSETSEKAIEAYLRKAVTEHGGLCLKYYNPHTAGYPDRIVITPEGLHVWVELKSTGERPRLLQQLRHEELRRLGVRVEVVATRGEAETLVAELFGGSSLNAAAGSLNAASSASQ